MKTSANNTDMFNVYYLTPGEFSQAVQMPGFIPASFETIEEAKSYIDGQVREEDKVGPHDNSNAATICYEIYKGSPFDEDGEVVAEPVYVSDDYYFRP